MKALYLTGLLALASPFSLADEATAAKLLDKVISHPGSYSQVCDVMSAPQDIPYRAFAISDFAGASFSKANQAEIAKNRDDLVKAIRAKLLRIDFTQKATDPTEDPNPEENNDGDAFGCDPKTLNPLLLNLVRELHAIEALPELLAVEAKLVEGIAKAKDDAKAAPPFVAGWSVALENATYDEKEDEAKVERRHYLFQARVAQRDLVMMMAVLLREKNSEPYLKSAIETAYAKGLKAKSKKDGLEKFKPGEPLPPELEGMEIKVDSITKLPYLEYDPVLIPYSRESRDEIRAAAEKWIGEHA